MGLFKRNNDKRKGMAKDNLSGNNYRFFLGQSTSGKLVNERTAMQMTAVYSCVRVLGEAIAGLPLLRRARHWSMWPPPSTGDRL